MGMMPSAKTGTVTFDLMNAINEIKAGRVEFRVDKAGITHNAIGRREFTVDQLFENAKAILQAIYKARPASVKGTYVKSVTIAPTMGPGIAVDPLDVQREVSA